MRIGIGLPAAVPGADMTTLWRWAAESERAGFAAVGVIDRLVYANLDPLIALAVAAGRTERVDLATTVLSIGWRNNPILVAKQLTSLDLASGGRLLAGLGLGGWPEDYLASRVPQAGNAAGWESSLAAMLSLAICAVIPLVGLLPRIAVEEAELARVLGGQYHSYQKATRRLVPGLW